MVPRVSYSGAAHRRPAEFSERETQGKLNLSRIENGPRSAVVRTRRTLTVPRRPTTRSRGIEWTKIRRPVRRVEVVHVQGVEQIEALSQRLQTLAFGNGERSR